MSNATSFKAVAGKAGSFVLRFAHGGLLALGLLVLAHLGSGHLKHESVHFSDTGLMNAHAAMIVELPQPVIDNPSPVPVTMRWRDQALAATPESVEEVALSEEMQRVRDWVSRRYRVSSVALEPVLAEAENSARGAGLDPLLIVAMMAVESSFNPFAESNMGAQGLMQVIPRWHMDKIGEDAGEDALFDPLLNVQVGTQVLVEGLQRYGSLQAALQYYGGARNDPEARYSKRVLAMKDQIASVARAGDA
jgi:hypothetical protein